MKTLLHLEELGLFLLSIVAFHLLDYTWWWYPALLLLPDVGMLGYVVNARAGAWIYNLCHHRAVAAALAAAGLLSGNQLWLLGSVIMFGHISMDRIFGYGLKFEDAFHRTHLGTIGRHNSRD